jgi:hypothetical protein
LHTVQALTAYGVTCVVMVIPEEGVGWENPRYGFRAPRNLAFSDGGSRTVVIVGDASLGGDTLARRQKK